MYIKNKWIAFSSLFFSPISYPHSQKSLKITYKGNLKIIINKQTIKWSKRNKKKRKKKNWEEKKFAMKNKIINFFLFIFGGYVCACNLCWIVHKLTTK